MEIILDTNILLLPARNNIDIFAEIDRLIVDQYELVTLSPVLSELEGISGSSKDGIAANVGLRLIEKKGVRIIGADTDADNAIISYVSGKKAMVATNDRALRVKLKKMGIPTIFMRSKSHLEMDGHG